MTTSCLICGQQKVEKGVPPRLANLIYINENIGLILLHRGTLNRGSLLGTMTAVESIPAQR
jgi:hypothetical protein